MNNSNNIFLTVHKITEDGIVSSYQYEEDFITQQVVSKTPIPTTNLSFNPHYTFNYSIDNKVNLNYRSFEPDEQSVTIVKIGGVEDLSLMNYATEISTVSNDLGNCKPFINENLSTNKSKRESKIPNIPTMVRCQNCDTNFPTKYQYQRHQCEFNADKVVCIVKPTN